jgi:hypothetical protein
MPDTPHYLIWLAAMVTLGIYTYLWSDNKLYRMLLNVMVGLGVGYNFIVIWNSVLGPLWWDPMVKGFQNRSWGMAWVLVGLLGLLWYAQFSRKYLWLSRIVIGMTLGAGAGMVFKAQFLLNMPQITDSFRPLVARADGSPLAVAGSSPFSLSMTLNNIIFVTTILCVMVYFLFSIEHKAKPIKGAATMGRWLLMVSFGAFFGNTVFTRMAVFLERQQYLIQTWAPIVPWWFWALCVAGILYAVVTSRKRRPDMDSGTDG